jgi:HAD superfamily hydrolase (TIGR01549 family)
MIKYRLLLWDFDGVIKDSVEVKTQAYCTLFEIFGSQVAEKVRQHHEANGGMSRFDKLPLYLKWAGIEPTEVRVSEYCEKFSQLALQGVVDSPWVAGVEQYLRNNSYEQKFVLISATPQEELEHILNLLDLTNCFAAIYGAPTRKHDAIRKSLFEGGYDTQDCLMIGDAKADFDAAQSNCVPFLLRRHEKNLQIFSDYTGSSIEDFARYE